jgi:hypothetical protein
LQCVDRGADIARRFVANGLKQAERTADEAPRSCGGRRLEQIPRPL